MTTPPLPAVTLRDVSKHFQNVKAVDGVSLEIQEGEVFTLLGPSGCGKTTTLRMLAGLEIPTGGDVYFRDRPIVVTARNLFVPPDKRNVGMVFQSYAIWPHLTVFENVAYALKVRGHRRAEIKQRVTDVLALLGLEGLEERPAPMLSGGQQQRVAFARALVYQPQLLLLDEPFSNLDAKLREQLRVELKLLQRRLGVTVVFVTHDQIEALSLSSRVAVMNRGRVEQLGNPHEVYEAPSTPFVRDFLGRTVLLRGRVREQAAGGYVTVSLRLPGAVLVGRSTWAEGLAPDREVFVAMRPEDIEVMGSDDASSVNVLTGAVEALLYVGERQEVDVRLDDGSRALAYAPRWMGVREDERVRLKVRPEAMTIWPA